MEGRCRSDAQKLTSRLLLKLDSCLALRLMAEPAAAGSESRPLRRLTLVINFPF